MVKEIEIDGRKIAFKCSAASPRWYRVWCGGDFLEDMQKLVKVMRTGEKTVGDLTLFENIAYTMARQADPGIPATPEEWLDGFTMFSIYNVLPELATMWTVDAEQLSEPKKKADPPTAG